MNKSIGGADYQIVLLADPLTGAALGAPVAGVDRSITATQTSQALIPANPARRSFYVANDTALEIFIRPGGAPATAVAGAGNVRVAPNGGFFELAGNADAWAIIATSGSPAITAREF